MSYAEIKEPKFINDGRGIALELKQRRKGFLGVGTTSGRSVIFNNNEVAHHIFSRLISAYDLQ